VSDDLRGRFKESLNRVPAEKLDELVDSILDVKKKVRVEEACRHCHKRQVWWVEVPDPVGQARAAAVLMDQAFGKPAEQRTVDVNVLVARSRQELEALSDSELVALAGVEEAEWKELGPGE